MKSVREYWRFLVGTKRTRNLTFLGLFVLLLVLPMTVMVAQEQQQIKQDAAQRRDKSANAKPNSCDSQSRIPGTLIVKYKNGIDPDSVIATAEVKKKIKKHKGKRKRRLETTNAETVAVSIGQEKVAAADLSTDPNVEYVECDAYVYAAFIPNDPHFDKQYAFRNTGQNNGKAGADINLTKVWDETRGNGVTVAVLDTGIDLDHKDLSSKIVKSKKFSESNTTDDRFGHGTHVAGIIAAKTDNGLGVAGACPGCRLLNVKVLDDTKKGAQSDVADGVNWAVQNHAKIINMSFSGDTQLQTLEAAINAAWEKGVLTIVAAGNEGKDTPTYPASYKNVIAVGATNNKDNRASFSNYGSDWVDVAAPGDKIYSTSPNHESRSGQAKDYAYLEGTSMASPMVAATAALIWAKEPNLSAAEVRKRIEGSTDKAGSNKDWKSGRINVAKAIANEVNEPPADDPSDDDTDDDDSSDEQLEPCPVNDDELGEEDDTGDQDKDKKNKKDKKDDKKKNEKKKNKKDKKDDKKDKDKTKRGNKDKKKGDAGKGGKGNDTSEKDGSKKDSGKKSDPTPTDKDKKAKEKKEKDDKAKKDKEAKAKKDKDDKAKKDKEEKEKKDKEKKEKEKKDKEKKDKSKDKNKKDKDDKNKKDKEDKAKKDKEKKEKEKKDKEKKDKSKDKNKKDKDDKNKKDKEDKAKKDKEKKEKDDKAKKEKADKDKKDKEKKDKDDKAKKDKEKRDKDKKAKDDKKKKSDKKEARRNPTNTPTPLLDDENVEDCNDPGEEGGKEGEEGEEGGKEGEEGEEGDEEGGEGKDLFFTVGLHGIGKGGDNRGPGSLGTANPLSTERDLLVEVYGLDNNLVLETDGVITYNSESGIFEGSVESEDLTPGEYILRVSSSTYLWRLVNEGNIVEITGDQEGEIPEVRLVAGDINEDNQLDILDFNELSSCYRAQSEFATSAAAAPLREKDEFGDEASLPEKEESLPVCDDQQALNTDLDDDGKVGGSDLNLFIIELLNPHGD